MLSLGAEIKVKLVGEGLGPPATSRYPWCGAKVFGFFALLPVELPTVFAVLFEAAKAKFSLCNNRVRLSKNAEHVCHRALCAVMALSHQGKLLNSALPNSV